MGQFVEKSIGNQIYQSLFHDMTDLLDKFMIRKRVFNNVTFVIGCFACSRFVLLVIGLLTQAFILPYFYGAHSQQYSGANALNMWGVWDSG